MSALPFGPSKSFGYQCALYVPLSFPEFFSIRTPGHRPLDLTHDAELNELLSDKRLIHHRAVCDLYLISRSFCSHLYLYIYYHIECIIIMRGAIFAHFFQKSIFKISFSLTRPHRIFGSSKSAWLIFFPNTNIYLYSQITQDKPFPSYTQLTCLWGWYANNALIIIFLYQS